MAYILPELVKRHLEREQHHDYGDESKGEEDIASGILHFY